jgi:hypothetical protein
MLRLYQQQNYFKSAVPGQGYDEYLDVRQNSASLPPPARFKSTGRQACARRWLRPGFSWKLAAHLGTTSGDRSVGLHRGRRAGKISARACGGDDSHGGLREEQLRRHRRV